MNSDEHPPAKSALIVSLGGFLFGIVTILHLRVDRSTRITRLVWHGPLAEYIGWLVATAVALSLLSVALASRTPVRWRSRSTVFGCVTVLFALLTLVLLFSIAGFGED